MKSINKRKFKSISSVLSKVLANNNLAHLHFLEEIKNGWAKFDKTIAAHSEPVDYNFMSKTLVLKIKNAIWKKEFLLNKEKVDVKIKNNFRNIKIKNIEII